MDRRRLFGYLCLTGFLVMIGLCWFSYRNYSYMMISAPGARFSVNGKIFWGNAAIGVNPSYGYSSWFTANAFPIKSMGIVDIEKMGWTRRIGFGQQDMRYELGGVTFHSYVYHYLYLPLWLIYLLFVVVTFLLLRPMRKLRLLVEM